MVQTVCTENTSIWWTNTSPLYINTRHYSTLRMCRYEGLCRHTLVWNDINIPRILTCTDIPVESSGAEPLLGNNRCEKEERKGENINTPMLWGSTRNATRGGREEVNPAVEGERGDHSKKECFSVQMHRSWTETEREKEGKLFSIV